MPRKPDPGKKALSAGEALLRLGARAERTAAQFDLLSAGNRRRWRAAFGGEAEARAAYVSGAALTAAQRGHAFTPSTPKQALDAPWNFPTYVGRHTDELNRLAREEGRKEHGTGPRGPRVTGRKKGESGEYTWVIPEGLLPLSDWRMSSQWRTAAQAQLEARRSGAPAGVVMIVDRGPGTLWRFQIWFGYPETAGVSRVRHKRGKRRIDVNDTAEAQIERIKRFTQRPAEAPAPKGKKRPKGKT